MSKKKKFKTSEEELLEVRYKRLKVITIASVLVLCIAFTVKVFQNDTFYTIKIGELIMKNGIDMLDHFSWHILPYTYPHWLYDVMIFIIYKFFGFTGIYISTMIFFITLIMSIYFVILKLNKNKFVASLMALVSVFVLTPYATARAQLVSYIVFTYVIYFIEMFMETKNKKYAIGLILLSLLLCNIHVAVWPFYFIMFLPYIAEYIIALFWDTKLRKKIFKFTIKEKFQKIRLERNDNAKWLIVIMFVSVLTGLLTPIGDTPYTYLINTMMGNSQNYIMEHLPPNLLQAPFLIAVVLELLIIMLFTKTKIKLRDLFMLCGLMLMASTANRHMALLVVVGLFYLSRFMTYFWEDEGYTIYLMLKGLTSKIGMVIFSCLVLFISVDTFIKNSKNNYVDTNAYPTKATNWITENLDIDSIKIYNEYNFGSYLLFKDIPVFIDSRADLYTKPFSGLDYDIFDDYQYILDNGYEFTFEKYGITHIITYKTSALYYNLRVDKNYELLYKDKSFVIYKRESESKS